MTLQRFMAKVEKDPASKCWNWTGCVMPGGYGQFRSDGEAIAHRWSYKRFRGPIPDGMDIDHLCRNRRCVNPSHLEAVTRQENLLRGETIPAAKAAQTHCERGHPLSGDNLYITPSTGTRGCRTCKAAHYRRWVKKNRARRRKLDRAHYRRKKAQRKEQRL